MNHAPVHARKCLLINVAPGNDRAARDVTAAQSFREGDDVRLEIPVLKSKHLPGSTESSLDFIGNQKRAVFATELLRATEKIGLRSLAAFPLHGLDHERGDLARPGLRFQPFDVVE